jgi:predicted aconitase with swiveling domain
MEPIVIRGRGALGGVAEGPALISRRTVTGWGGIDIRTGKVKEPGHPLEGMSLKGSILILEGSRGSNGWSIFFHAAQVAGFGPAALVFPHLDSRTAVTAAVLNVPMVTDLEGDPFALINVGDRVRVDGDRGVLTVIKSAGDSAIMEGED